MELRHLRCFLAVAEEHHCALAPTPALLLTLDADNRSTGLFARAYSRMWEAPGAEGAVTIGLRAAF